MVLLLLCAMSARYLVRSLWLPLPTYGVHRTEKQDLLRYGMRGTECHLRLRQACQKGKDTREHRVARLLLRQAPDLMWLRAAIFIICAFCRGHLT